MPRPWACSTPKCSYPRRLRRLVAFLSLALVCLVTQAPALARTEDSNLIRVTATVAADLPVGVRGDPAARNDGNIYFTSFGAALLVWASSGNWRRMER